MAGLAIQILFHDLIGVFSFAPAPAWFMFPLFHIMPFFSLMSGLVLIPVLLFLPCPPILLKLPVGGCVGVLGGHGDNRAADVTQTLWTFRSHS